MTDNRDDRDSDTDGPEPETGRRQEETGDDERREPTGRFRFSRRTALKTGGLLGLLGLGVATASADAQGQVGNSDDPLNALYTEEINGGVTGDQTLTDLAGTGLSINSGTLDASGSSSWEDGDGDDLLEPTDSAITGIEEVGTVQSPAETALTLNAGLNRALRLEIPTSDNAGNTAGGNVVAGHPNNAVNDGAVGAVIGGGGNSSSGSENLVYDEYGTVGGGIGNQAGSADSDSTTATYTTVGGGRSNTASGEESTVGGGNNNTASSRQATIGGGEDNTASGSNTTIGGGFNNTASDGGAAVAGGNNNEASGFESSVGGGTEHTASGDHATIGGGRQNTASSTQTTVGGGNNNTASGAGTTVAGGEFNEATTNTAAVGGGQSNSATGIQATIAGGHNNEASGVESFVGGGNHNRAAAQFATIAGGGPSDTTDSTTRDDTRNVVYDDYGTIGGGGNNQAGSDDGNTATDEYATVGGGQHNTASGFAATVGGGQHNTASDSATVGGGNTNTASGTEATVGGGQDNTASASNATVPGGRNNTADGQYSFATGRNADANANDGAFVWGDSTSNAVTAGAADQAVFQAGGGMTVYTSSDLSTGVELPSGSGTWSTLSSKTAKSCVETVSPPEVLDAVESLDVATWRYDAEDDAIRHMGPMAEEFYDAFGLGHDERRISNVDADGVALAAIQGLSEELDDREERIDEQRDRIDDLEAENERLRGRNDELAARLERIEDRLGIDGTAE